MFFMLSAVQLVIFQWLFVTTTTQEVISRPSETWPCCNHRVFYWPNFPVSQLSWPRVWTPIQSSKRFIASERSINQISADRLDGIPYGKGQRSWIRVGVFAKEQGGMGNVWLKRYCKWETRASTSAINVIWLYVQSLLATYHTFTGTTCLCTDWH